MDDYKAAITAIGDRLFVSADTALIDDLIARVPGALPDPIRAGVYHWPENYETLRALVKIIGYYSARLCKYTIMDYGARLVAEFHNRP